MAIAAALMSLFRHRAIHQEMAMTGEVTLTGRVLPVGGVREKVLAARRAGITTVLIPRHNEKDLVELPAEVKADVTFHSIDTLDDVVGYLFPAKPKPTAAKPSALRPASPRPRKRLASPPCPDRGSDRQARASRQADEAAEVGLMAKRLPRAA